MIRNRFIYVARFKLALSMIATLSLSSAPALAETKNDDTVILIGAFSDVSGPPDGEMDWNGISFYLWRHGETLLGGVNLTASAISDEAMIFNGHYHAETSTLDFRVEFPRIPGGTTVYDPNIESRPFPRPLMAMDFHLAIRNHKLIGTGITFYDDEKDAVPEGITTEINIPMIKPSILNWTGNYIRNFDNQSEWFDFAWCELSSRDYKDFFKNIYEQIDLCKKYNP